ncbi:chloramphenicol acetyltransferase [Taibaiella sp. KBW10]|uniref:chloramphenicol acetyltransferase n=1 Tax=Taibaiella sp. KBW10 TaxID=2153357 RepID=UPI000F5B04C5|nr:chloramphenicol acetyltransferase [Taibaiella sp. KBW10]RQO32365.1 chloramphenicol acetyltransferase [Taibaiella sp. KBW10]
MKTALDITQWSRRDHFAFFSQFEEPFFGVTVTVDVTNAYEQAKKQNISFFLYYLYRALKAANEIENFRYRIIDEKVFIFDQVNASPTINRPNGTFGFAYMDYTPEAAQFYTHAQEVIAAVQVTEGLRPAVSGENVIQFSALPWIDFSSISHARSFSFADSCPKISFGKVSTQEGRKTMPVSIHVHHGLMDGYHVGLYIEAFQKQLDQV